MSEKMQIHQMLASVSYGDAISDYALELQSILRKRGYNSEIFVELFDSRMAKYIRRFEEYINISSSNFLLLFHFSIASRVSKLAFHLPEKKILIYHNITPSHYFSDFHPHLAGQCYHGRRELRAFVDKCNLALGDSEFNRKELEKLGFSPTGVFPIYINFDKFNVEPHPIIKELYGNKKDTFLFVGRVIPNKKFEDIFKIFHFYKKYINKDSQLILAGEYRGFERYFYSLQDLLCVLDLSDVYFTGHVDLNELVSLYQLADVFICMSEHEGFCVPILESYYFQVPVLAYASAAVPGTLKDGGILINNKDYEKIAEMAHLLITNKPFRKRIIERQNKVLQEHRNVNTEALLMSYIEKALKA
jgi:glycosyltransferase involved in cell wall biosynthesis